MKCTLRIFRSKCFPLVLLCFMASYSMVGLVKAMGILFDDISRSIQITSTDLGITLGLFYAGGLFTTPLVAALFGRISNPRLLVVILTMLGNGGIVLASMATNKLHLFIAFAVSGSGYNTALYACSTVLGQIAGQNFNVLYSLSTCGNSLGMVILPLLTGELLDAYGWRGVLLILGALLSNAIPCALAIRVGPEDHTNMKETKSHDINPEDKVSNSVVPTGSSGEGTDGDHSDEENGLVKDISRTPLLALPLERDRLQDDPSSLSPSLDSLTHENRLNNIIKIPRMISMWFQSTNCHNMGPVPPLIILSNMVLYFVYTGWHAFLIPHVLQRGFSQNQTVMIAFLAAVGNLSIRLVVAFVTHKLVDPISMHLVLTIVNIISLACDAFVSNYYLMLVTSGCSAATIAGRAVLAPLAIRGRVSDKTFAVALGVNTFMMDCGLLLGGYLSGLTAARFSSYDATFKLLAGIEFMTFSFMLLVKIIEKPTKNNSCEAHFYFYYSFFKKE